MRKFLVGCIALFGSALAQAADNPAVQRLETLLGNLKTWQASFEQTVEGGKSKKPVKGTFYLQRPGKFHWETSAPYHQRLVADGHALWTYDLDLEQITVQDLDKGLGATPASLLSGGDSDLARDFHVDLVAGGKPGEEVFELAPKMPSSLYDHLGMVFVAGKLTEMSVSNTMNQRTVVRFSDTHENPALDQALFQFRAPEGVDLIDSRKQR